MPYRISTTSGELIRNADDYEELIDSLDTALENETEVRVKWLTA